MASYSRDPARHAPPQVFAVPDCQCVALPDQERLPVAAPAARVSVFATGLLLFPALADGRALGPAQPGRCAATASPPPPARGPVAAIASERSGARCPIHQLQRAGRVGQRVDGHKKIQGRKRQLIVDTGGLLLAAHVGPAHENDRIGNKAALQNLAQQGFERLHLVLVDAGYGGQPLAQWTRDHCRWRLETAPGSRAAVVLPPPPAGWSSAPSAACNGTDA